MIRPCKQLFIIAFSWKVAIAQHLICVIFQGPSAVHQAVFMSLLLKHESFLAHCRKIQDKCKTGYYCVADNEITDSCAA